MRIIFILGFLLLFFTDLIAQKPVLVLPTGHTNLITGLEVSADDKRVYTRDSDGQLRIWDAISGLRLADISTGCFEMSKDRNFFLTNSMDTILLWDANKSKLLRKASTGARQFLQLAISNDGHFVASVSDGSSITIRLANNLTPVLNWESKTEIEKVSFSEDNDKLFSLCSDKSIHVWDIATGKELLYLPPGKKYYQNIYMPAKVNKLILVSEDQVFVLDAITGALLHRHEGYRVGFSIDNQYLFIATPRKGIVKTDIHSGKYLMNIQTGEYNYINQLAPAPGNSVIGTVCADKTADLWDLNSGNLLKSFSGFGTAVKHIRFSKNGEKIYTASEDEVKIWQNEGNGLVKDIRPHSYKTWSVLHHPFRPEIIIAQNDSLAKVWNTIDGQPELTLGKHTEGVEYGEFSPDGKKMLTVADSSVFIWDAGSGKLLASIRDAADIYSAHFSNDQTKILTAGYRHVSVWSAANNSRISVMEGLNGLIGNATFTEDGQTVITGSDDSLVVWWNANTGKIIKGTIMNAGVDQVSISPDQKSIAVAQSDHKVKIVDATTREVQYTLTGHSDKIHFLKWNRAGDMLLTASFDNSAITWDTKTGEKLNSLVCDNMVYTAVFSQDEKKIITCSRDNIVRLWNTADGKLINSFFSIDSTGFFNILPNGYYFGSANSSKLLHYVTGDLKVISFEQLDVKYNRPDKVLEAIGNQDTALIRSYRKAWEKRVKKLGIDTTQFLEGYSVPECDFTNRDNIDYEQKNGTLKLQIKGIDSTYKLDRFNVWVNEAPIFGQRGISLKRRNSNDLDTTITVVLSEGENRIETSITNVNGTESYRMPLIVKYSPATKQSVTTHFIGIGIDKFKDSKNDLQYSSKDIRDLSFKLKEKYGNAVTIDTLFNENVNVTNVIALKAKLKTTTVNDKVIIAYSGHGLLSKDFDYFLSTYNINFEKPEEEGLPYDELENLLDSIPARKKLMLIDACHSGEVDKEELVRINKASDSMHLTKGGITVAYESDGKLGMKNSFELMQNLFVNVGKSTGATIISAAAGTQFALERGDLKNGVFTYCILEAMEKKKTMKISEIKKIVGQRVEELTNGLQKPTSRNENIAVDWELW
ncbi:MAG: caspase family protein [Chitinophagaceae bacterium]|nr:caspase family protein [Chitinophagaceae bacterium]